MAAAYGFHLGQNPPFLDGNKRTAFIVMATFLRQNGLSLFVSNEDAYQVMMQVATNQMDKEALARWLEKGTSIM
jgi:death-on-curing protein